MGLGESALVVVFIMSVVFSVLIGLYIVIEVFSRVFAATGKKS